jgi:hypothetical protein
MLNRKGVGVIPEDVGQREIDELNDEKNSVKCILMFGDDDIEDPGCEDVCLYLCQLPENAYFS